MKTYIYQNCGSLKKHNIVITILNEILWKADWTIARKKTANIRALEIFKLPAIRTFTTVLVEKVSLSRKCYPYPAQDKIKALRNQKKKHPTMGHCWKSFAYSSAKFLYNAAIFLSWNDNVYRLWHCKKKLA